MHAHRSLFALVPALALASCCFGALGAPSDDALTADVRDRLALALPDATITIVGSRTLAVTIGEDQLEMHLDNLALECQSAPELCDAVIDRHVASTVEVLREMTAPPSPGQIRAVLHDPEWMRQAEASEGRLTSRPFVADLSIVYVVDYPTTISTLAPEVRTQLGLGDDDALHTLALRNMAVALAAFPTQPFPGAPGVSVLSAGDSYEAARVLLHDRWAELARTVSGDLLVSVPCRDQVLFAGSADPAHVAALRATTDRLESTEHHAISRAILRWTPAGWEVFEAR